MIEWSISLFCVKARKQPSEYHIHVPYEAYIKLGLSQTEVWLLSSAWFKIAGIYSAGLKSDSSMIVKYCLI